jgi:nucleoside-diphosphate-sugar epimerase
MIKPSLFSGKKILVTGASGFIGSCLCQKLLSMGAEVHGVSRTLQPKGSKNLYWWQGDVADIAIVRELLTKIEPGYIFHLAGHNSGSRDLSLVLPTLNSNLISTVNLLTASTEIGCDRIIIIGSLEEPDSGSAEVIPSSPYAAGKWCSSAYARMFHALYQTPVVNARVFMVYGPGQMDLLKLIPYVTLSLLRDNAPKVSSGKRQMDWIYVEDVVEGLLAIMQSPGIEGNTVDLGSGVLVPVRTVVEKISKIVNANVYPLFGAIGERPMEQIRVAQIKNTHTMTGWKPTTPLEKGLENTVHWYKENLNATEKRNG